MKYTDTSAFVKRYGNEENEKGIITVSELIEAARNGEETLLSNFLIIGESISTFDKWVRQKAISQNELDRLIKKFLADISELHEKGTLILEPVSSSTILFCLELITKHHISLNDALHLYTALTNREMVELFVCSDENLLNAAKAEGLNVFNPEEF
ncbi:type II toxin-antitoxin system VapC family toxin [Candidatus Woesearchaeota archaeon]|nr:type II toxin-antitoxin system VapC family toxin [Candidatus Woesearchaeota archaeon]